MKSCRPHPYPAQSCNGRRQSSLFLRSFGHIPRHDHIPIHLLPEQKRFCQKPLRFIYSGFPIIVFHSYCFLGIEEYGGLRLCGHATYHHIPMTDSSAYSLECFSLPPIPSPYGIPLRCGNPLLSLLFNIITAVWQSRSPSLHENPLCGSPSHTAALNIPLI